MSDYRLTQNGVVYTPNNAFIPSDPGNDDYKLFLAWQQEGNEPDPIIVEDPKVAIQNQIDSLEYQQLLPRITREFMLEYLAATYTSEQLAQNVGYTKLKEFDDQIASLRTQINDLGA